MARKKPNPGRDPSEPGRPGRKRPRPTSPAEPVEFDWKIIEQAMWRMLGRAAPTDEDDPRSPRNRAAVLIRVAFASDQPRRIIELARQALEIWPDCADAYILLAEQTRGPKAAHDLYVQGVEAAARDLGENVFRMGVGRFWTALPTRPYMRARLGLAQALWVLGRREEAVAHYEEMIRLNPADDQGVRYLLASGLIELGRDEALTDLLARFKRDDSTCWAYSAALLAFRREGDSLRARRLLTAARRDNPFVLDYLLGREPLPPFLPDGSSRGDVSEAASYATRFLSGWRATPDALAWLRRSERKSKPRPRREPPSTGPTAASKQRLARLPQSDEVWQADARLLPMWITPADEPYRPWVVVVTSVTEGLILGQEVCEVSPSPLFFWDKVSKIMTSPREGPPRRPAALQLGSGDRWASLQPFFEQIGLKCEAFEEIELIDEIVKDLVEHMSGRPIMPGLLAMPGIEPPQVASFYQAAAEFYRLAPWQHVGGIETIKVACDRFQSGPWYAAIFGQMGMTLGLALYDSYENLRRLRERPGTDEENARATVALSLSFGTKIHVAIADLESTEAYGWEVAAPDAYPSPVRKERGYVMRPPLAWELQLLEAATRALPAFVTEHDRDDLTPEFRTVPTGLGPLCLELTWVPGGLRG